MAINHREILVLDDDEVFCEALKDHLEMRGYAVSTASCIADAVHIFKEKAIDVAFIDQQLPDGDGLVFSKDLIRSGVGTKNVLITAFAGVSAAVDAIRAGAFDYLQKPVSLEALEVTLKHALQAAEIEAAQKNSEQLATGNVTPSSFVGTSEQMMEVRAQLRAIANAHPAPVLITGETGTGKGLAARIIQNLSQIPNRKFITVNCAAIPETMFEAELFGHERGAFTGAYRATKGLFELADGGILLLDEIGEIPYSMQAKLLRVLEDGLVRRLGSYLERRVRVRILASTNRNLQDMVSKNRFRADLFYRLAVLHIEIPPLRTHKEDIAELIRYLTKNHQPRVQKAFDEEVVMKLQEYDWPGNVRELRNTVQRALTLTKQENTTAAEMLFSSFSQSNPADISMDSVTIDRSVPIIPSPSQQPLLTLAELEKKYIEYILNKVGGNRTHAAKLLGLSRSTLKRWLRNQSPPAI